MRTGWIRLGLIASLTVSCADSNFQLREVDEAVPQDLSADSTAITAHAAPPSNSPSKPKKEDIHHQIRLKASDEWKLLDDEDGVKTYIEANPKQDHVAFRGEVLIPAPIKKVITVMNDPALRKQWVDSLLESRAVDIKSDFDRIEYNLTKVPWPFQNRDFIYRVKTKLNFKPATVHLTMKSVEDHRIPIQDGVVRGEITFCEYLIQEKVTSAGVQTLVIVEMAVNPKGAIPAWLVNLAQKRWPKNTLSGMRRVSLKPNITVPKEIESIFSQKKTRGSI